MAKTKVAYCVCPKRGRKPGLKQCGSSPHLGNPVGTLDDRSGLLVAWDGRVVSYLELPTRQDKLSSAICVTIFQLFPWGLKVDEKIANMHCFVIANADTRQKGTEPIAKSHTRSLTMESPR